MEYYLNIACGLVILFYLFIVMKYELQMMQQNSYRNKRYLKWLKSDLFSIHRALDIVVFIILIFFAKNIFVLAAAAVFSLIRAIIELQKKYKKKLVFTNRAIRLYLSASILSLLIVSFFACKFDIYYSIVACGAIISVPFLILMAANIINSPIEKIINNSYNNDAKRILQQYPDLLIIGITGSYGKTSTKHYLYRILSEQYNVLMTPGSYNTTMGVVRTIREQLKPYHNVFIVEMGAKQNGDIKEICDLVNPRIGIITAVGEQHLESFKNIENVQKTKFELIDSLPQDGVAILNYDFEYIANREVNNLKQVIYYSLDNEKADYFISDINYTAHGTEFTINNSNDSARLSTKLLGSYNISNIVAAYIVARKLNIDSNQIKYATSQIEQVEHRLNVRKTASGLIIIDDAFNSNPYGAKMAMEVIRNFSGKRIVVTPGMIELGDKQFEFNCKFGSQMAESCDYVIIVGVYNRDAILKGLKDNSFPENSIYLADTFADAVAQISKIAKSGDVILYENDLPDTFK